MKIFKKIVYMSLISTILLPIAAFAGSISTDITIPNPATKTGINDIQTLITVILNNIVMPIAAVAVVIYIVYAGFTFVTAQGKPAEIDKAKQRLLWALIGAGILLGAAAISTVIKNTVTSLL